MHFGFNTKEYGQRSALEWCGKLINDKIDDSPRRSPLDFSLFREGLACLAIWRDPDGDTSREIGKTYDEIIMTVISGISDIEKIEFTYALFTDMTGDVYAEKCWEFISTRGRTQGKSVSRSSMQKFEAEVSYSNALSPYSASIKTVSQYDFKTVESTSINTVSTFTDKMCFDLLSSGYIYDKVATIHYVKNPAVPCVNS